MLRIKHKIREPSKGKPVVGSDVTVLPATPENADYLV
jgi:hypothetical protein